MAGAATGNLGTIGMAGAAAGKLGAIGVAVAVANCSCAANGPTLGIDLAESARAGEGFSIAPAW